MSMTTLLFHKSFQLFTVPRKTRDLCDDCLESTALVGDFLIREEEIEFQTLEFITYICTDEPTFTTCTENIVLVSFTFSLYIEQLVLLFKTVLNI